MIRVLMCVVVLGASVLHAQAPTSPSPRQTQEDDYTRYELLAPDSAQFRIYYEVTATTAGATFFYNTIRPGSVATDERVIDLATGQPLKWEVVSGTEARPDILPPTQKPNTSRCTWPSRCLREAKPGC
jgi:hypothetical protein